MLPTPMSNAKNSVTVYKQYVCSFHHHHAQQVMPEEGCLVDVMHGRRVQV